MTPRPTQADAAALLARLRDEPRAADERASAALEAYHAESNDAAAGGVHVVGFVVWAVLFGASLALIAGGAAAATVNGWLALLAVPGLALLRWCLAAALRMGGGGR